jgi:beta-glucanase (GH16 family)
MKTTCLFILFVCLSCTVLAQHKVDTVFYESFNAKNLDRSKWNVEVTGRTVNNEQQAYVDSASTLTQANGLLHIKPVYHPGYVSDQQKKYDFLSGRINTRGKMEFTYGTASAKIKCRQAQVYGRPFGLWARANGPIAAKLISWKTWAIHRG